MLSSEETTEEVRGANGKEKTHIFHPTHTRHTTTQSHTAEYADTHIVLY